MHDCNLCIYLFVISWKAGDVWANGLTLELPLCLLQLQNTVVIQSHSFAAESVLFPYYHKYAILVGTFKWGSDGKLFPF